MAKNLENDVNSTSMGDSDSERTISVELSPDLLTKDDGEVLSPDPISFILTASSQVIPGSSLDCAIKRMRRGKCAIEEIQEVSFGLFEHQNGGENYILEMNEIEKGEKNLFQVFINMKEEKLDVRVKKLSLQRKANVVPVEVENSSTKVRYNLPLPDRLKGWRMEKRKRNNAQTYDKYYIHEKVGCFRSLNEVAVFIVYSCRKEDMLQKKAMNHSEEPNKTTHNIEDIPSTQGTEGESHEVKEDDPIFSFAINNPIIDNL